jgi:hypothetical protein
MRDRSGSSELPGSEFTAPCEVVQVDHEEVAATVTVEVAACVEE